MPKGLLKKRIAEYIREQKEAQKRDEARKRDEERIRLEGEVANLFYEYDTIYDKIRYMPKVDELLEFLNDKNNAAGFWQNPHVKMLYNISDHHNFLLSIYTEETNSQRYEEWLKQNFSNPFFNNMAVNPEMLKTIAEADSKNYDKILYGCIDSLCRIQAEHRRYTIFERDDSYLADYSRAMIKAVNSSSLLDIATYTNFIKETQYCDKIYSYNPLMIMNNNFLRLDTYNNWRNKFKKYWEEVSQRDPIMFRILDALVKSRKIYIKQLNK